MKFSVLFLITVSVTGINCSDSRKQPAGLPENVIKEPLIRANRQLAHDESLQIDNYISRRGLQMQKTGTGLRYMISKPGNGKAAAPGMNATVNFTLSLLDGTICYSSDSTGAETFTIDHDQVESGLHEGVKLLREGDRAKFILPSHLAHGLLGDNNKIPPRSPVVYDIQLLELK